MIDLLPSPEQQQIIDSVRQVLAARLPLQRLPGRAPAAPYGAAEPRPGGASDDLACWPQVVELGWLALDVPEAAGGVGLGLAEQALVCREYGRVLAPPALLATALALRVALQAGQHAWRSGCCTASCARRTAWPRRRPDAGAPAAVMLVDAGADDVLLAWSGEGAWLHPAVPPAARQALRGLDEAAPLARARLAAPLCGTASDEAIDARAAVLLAAYQCGLAEAVRDMAVEYAQTREQFGQPIGAFQAIKHRCVDVAVAAELAWAQTAFAALSAARGAAQFRFQAAAALLVASRAAIDGAEANIQIHGGIGFTAELNAQALLKRAHLIDRIGGGMRHQQARILAAPAAA